MSKDLPDSIEAFGETWFRNADEHRASVRFGPCSAESPCTIHRRGHPNCHDTRVPYNFKPSRGPHFITPEAVDKFLTEHAVDYERLATEDGLPDDMDTTICDLPEHCTGGIDCPCQPQSYGDTTDTPDGNAAIVQQSEFVSQGDGDNVGCHKCPFRGTGDEWLSHDCRIVRLEQERDELRAEVESMRPVVEKALAWNNGRPEGSNYRERVDLLMACHDYEVNTNE